MRTSILIVLLLIINHLSTAQVNKIRRTLNNEMDRNEILIELNKLARVATYKAGETLRFAAKFKLNSDGRMVDIKVLGPVPQIESMVENTLVLISGEINWKKSKIDTSKLYSMPLNFTVESDQKLIERMRRQKILDSERDKN